jgi:hypothetical protein
MSFHPKMQARRSSEKSVNFYHTTLSHIAEDSALPDGSGPQADTLFLEKLF